MSSIQTEQKERRHLWTPVQRPGADGYLITLIVTFGITVMVTRAYLQLTGFPQVGNGTFHIAHVLWGGLALFGAVLVLLIWSNHWTFWVGAVLGGIGVGLFIDEVGKFITQSVDYFFPLALPIVYALLLASVWLYLRVRRSRPRDTRSLLYAALEDLKQVLDNDVEPFEHRNLVQTLTRAVALAEDATQKRLAQDLLAFVQSQDVHVMPSEHWLERLWQTARLFFAFHPSRKVGRIILIAGFAAMAIPAVLHAATLLAAARSAGYGGVQMLLSNVTIVSGNSKYIVDSPLLLGIDTGLILITGILSLAASGMLIAGRERLALRTGMLALILAITVVNLITFYFNQFTTFFELLLQLALLVVALWYRWRFIDHPNPVKAPVPE